MELFVVPYGQPARIGPACPDREANLSTRTPRQRRAFHEPRAGREVVSAQLQRRAESRVHGTGEGRRARIPSAARGNIAMSANRYRWPHRLAAVAASAVLAAPVHASGPKLAAPVHDAWSRECGSCHIAYPPRLLPAASWQAIMQGLDRHFGSDATIDASAASSIGAFLQA